MPHRSREDRILDLQDELLDHPTDDFLSPKMTQSWAEKCLEFESEERDAVVAFLKHAQAPKVIIDMIERGAHRKRSTQVMKELKAVQPELAADRKKLVDKMLREFVGTEANQSGVHRKFATAASGGRR